METKTATVKSVKFIEERSEGDSIVRKWGIKMDNGDAIAPLRAVNHQVIQHHFETAAVGEPGEGVVQSVIHQLKFCRASRCQRIELCFPCLDLVLALLVAAAVAVCNLHTTPLSYPSEHDTGE